MKKWLIVIFVLITFIACGDEKNDQKQKSVEVDNKEKQEQVKEQPVTNEPKITVTADDTKIENDNPFISYDVNGNRFVNIAPDGEETPVTKELGALISIRNNYTKLNAKILAQRLSRNYILKCSACHDDYANGVIGPSLLNDSESEIFDKIKAFQNKTKTNVLMYDLISKMSDDEIKSLASEIAKLNEEVRKTK